MSEIEIITTIHDLINPDELVELIQKQISLYSENSQYEQIKKAVINALKKESRSLFFLWNDPTVPNESRMGAFIFANVCSGLESGADYLWINELFVDEQFRKRGVASQLLQYIEKWSLKNDIVYIACSTGMKNISAQELYRKNGFDLDPTMWVDKSV